MLLIIIFLLIALFEPKIAYTQEPTPSAVPGNIFISEFSEVDEWVEIYNDNDFALSLQDWYLQDLAGTKIKISDQSVNPKSFFIFEFSKTFLNNDPSLEKPEKLSFYDLNDNFYR